jgi:hypothetical protein
MDPRTPFQKNLFECKMLTLFDRTMVGIPELVNADDVPTFVGIVVDDAIACIGSFSC